MEKIAKKQLNGFAGLTDIFINEVQKSSNSDGFIHAPSGFHFKLFNNSEVHTLCGDEKNSKGKRSNFNLYDESGWLTSEFIADTSKFTSQDSSFQLGGDIDTSIIPDNIPNQILLCSSASDVDSEFYRLYKDYTKNMLIHGAGGEYFTATIDCDVVINATFNGVKLEKPLLTREKVDADIAENPSKNTREYYCKFDTDGGESAPIKRVDIMRNSHPYVPILSNDDLTRKRYFGIAHDPAHNYDNSIITVAEYYKTEEDGWRMRFLNCINLTDLEKKRKTPLRQPEQLKILKDTIIDYNGLDKADYENIEMIIIDSGSGGGGNTIPDEFYEEWKGKDGKMHKGIVDRETYPEDSAKFPNAINKLQALSPKTYRNIIFDEFVNLLSLGVIDFPTEYDNKKYIMIPEESDKLIDEVQEDGTIKQVKSIDYKKYRLSPNEEKALIELNAMKEELIAIRTTGKSGNISYLLPSDISGCRLKDDRAYTAGLLSHHLAELRREGITNKESNRYSSNRNYVFI